MNNYLIWNNNLGLENQKSLIDLETQEILSKVINDLFNHDRPDYLVKKYLDAYLQSTSRNKTFDFIPGLLFFSNSNSDKKIVPIITAWQVIRLSAKILDDVEDGDISTQISSHINLATTYIFFSESLLDSMQEFGISDESAFAIKKKFSEACLNTCIGQKKDILIQDKKKICTPDQWLEIAHDKTGELFAWACWSGAMVCELEEKVLNNCWNFGLNMGVLVQIADDYNDVWGSSPLEEPKFNGVSLPFCYACFVDKKQEKGLSKNLENQVNNNPVPYREILSNLGVQKFIISIALEYYRKAKSILDGLPIPNKNYLDALFILNSIFPALVHLE